MDNVDGENIAVVEFKKLKSDAQNRVYLISPCKTLFSRFCGKFEIKTIYKINLYKLAILCYVATVLFSLCNAVDSTGSNLSINHCVASVW